MPDEKPGQWSDALQCHWCAWSVVAPGRLRLDLPEMSHNDMTGAIQVAEVLMPGCVEIATFNAGVPDIIYRFSKGRWLAFDPPAG